MNRLVITKIVFRHENGVEEAYTSVDVSFQAINVDFELRGTVSVSRGQYHPTGGDINALKDLIFGTYIARPLGKTVVDRE